MAQQNDNRTGVFLTAKDRESYGKDLRQAHFSLGTYNVPTTTSYSNQFAKPATNDQAGRTIDTKTLCKTHFVLGLDKDDRESIYKRQFGSKIADKVALNQEIMKDLRATHYTLGTDPRNFQSVQKQDFIQPVIEQKSRDTIEAMKKKMRTHCFKYGDDPIKYESYNAAMYKAPDQSSNTSNKE